MWTRLFGPWGGFFAGALSVLIITGVSIAAAVSGHPTSRTENALIAVAVSVGGTLIAAIVGAVVLHRRNTLIAQKRGGPVFGVVRLDEHAFKLLTARSGSTKSMDDGTFALVSTSEAVEFWKSAETDVPAISLPRSVVTAASFAPYAAQGGGGIELSLDTTESVLMMVVGWGGILPPRDNAIASVLAELSLPAEPAARRWISS